MANLRERLKELILKKEGINKEEVLRLFKESKDLIDFRKKLQEANLLKEEEYCQFLSQETGLVYFDLSKFKIDKSQVGLIPQELAYKYQVLPISKIKNAITLACSDPPDLLVLDDLRLKLGSDIDLVLVKPSQIRIVLEEVYKKESPEHFLGTLESSMDNQAEVVGEEEAVIGYDVVAESSKPPIVRVVDLVISEALNRRASDIHIEPEEDRIKIRYRIDGVLHEAFSLPKKNQNAIIARLKIMSSLNITESRIPQDGRFKVRLENKEVDFRVSSLPTKYGEKFVLRALDKSNLSIGLEKLGFSERPRQLFEEALKKPFGILLVTGPTGSGKSTTLYSIINHLNTPQRNIITIEDPVEYQIEGITQIQVYPEIGLTFANCLRAVLRQSPDIIMVGEIRDSETADIAIKASLTGELILSTLHTNDSVGAITRLVDMGVEPYLLASSLVMTSAQRLCRKICPQCKTSYKVSQKVLEKLGLKDKDIDFYIGKGCPSCRGTGYLGREAVLEVLLVDDKIKEMIVSKETEEKIASYACKELDFRTLREDALDKAFRGVTSLKEVFRIT
ncbi:MAG: type II secretion system protein GspE [Candidatus Omnitrophota bacterium]|nr:MAG: type II secretion system protein GspE [Candidatus Omnitrophota bacterium]